MLDQIKGLHHVTSMAKDARQNNDFFTRKLGLRRVKQTVNSTRPMSTTSITPTRWERPAR